MGAMAHARDGGDLIPLTTQACCTSINMWFPESPSAARLRMLATDAVEAAARAGADFADIRVGVQRTVSVPVYPFSPRISLTVGYGIRACVNGAWSFQHGNLLTTDAVTTAARNAVAGAHTYAAVNARLARMAGGGAANAWAFTPVVTGEWQAPRQIDPFTVPLDDYHRVLDTFVTTTVPVHQNVRIGSFALGWRSDVRVFASTDGSLVTQDIVYGGPSINGSADLPDTWGDGVSIDTPAMGPVMGGFETALHADLITHVLYGVDEAIRFRRLPRRPFLGVGRFPVIFGGGAFGQLIGQTASVALDADRVFGLEADASGGSFLAPATDVLGADKPQFSPLLTMRCDRTASSVSHVQWDDDGVVPEPYTLIDHGHVVDYHTTRETAPMLADWYTRHNRPIRSHGGTVATSPASVPLGGGGHVTVDPVELDVGVPDLMRDLAHGFFVRRGGASLDPSLTGGMFTGGDIVLEIRDGKPVARTNVRLQFATKAVLGVNLVALGDVQSTRTSMITTSKGMPWQTSRQLMTAPAALCKDVDVLGPF